LIHDARTHKQKSIEITFKVIIPKLLKIAAAITRSSVTVIDAFKIIYCAIILERQWILR